MELQKQIYLMHALERVEAVLEEQQDRKVVDAYGGLCHKFPMLLRNHGLAQTCAWIEAKSSGNSPLSTAYGLLREHVAATLNLENPSDLLAYVREANVQDYMLRTYILMDAWVYHKRFAVSILQVQDASGSDEEDN